MWILGGEVEGSRLTGVTLWPNDIRLALADRGSRVADGLGGSSLVTATAVATGEAVEAGQTTVTLSSTHGFTAKTLPTLGITLLSTAVGSLRMAATLKQGMFTKSKVESLQADSR